MLYCQYDRWCNTRDGKRLQTFTGAKLYFILNLLCTFWRFYWTDTSFTTDQHLSHRLYSLLLYAHCSTLSPTGFSFQSTWKTPVPKTLTGQTWVGQVKNFNIGKEKIYVLRPVKVGCLSLSLPFFYHQLFFRFLASVYMLLTRNLWYIHSSIYYYIHVFYPGIYNMHTLIFRHNQYYSDFYMDTHRYHIGDGYVCLIRQNTEKC